MNYPPPAPDPYQPYALPPVSPMPMGYTGPPQSDKSKVTAGLLQLLPGFLLGLGGIGRLYAGHTALGVTQLVATLIGWISLWCAFVLFVPVAIFTGVWLWFVIDGIVLMSGNPVDGQGRPLRA
ncbi:hypothetical protein Cs7R123_80270 [Catellatospora sp. TT07R-123]|uniref:NINE protein n=1 Tax=Catellatospora sp. TT07R-123 TaxID=2733863 RepID=UPI001B27ED82|nr:NINE protein [Catellatospora sp. TT07R-123]GHJ50681.1 hypothetical protein Cs7R123_80230 [Catellatospora sp. TT07R-123]GHJ50685.1 hypothetical protein Cs7R123_80270 [Catellatospora sp. TT07R-123]